METPAKWNYSPGRVGCPAALTTTSDGRAERVEGMRPRIQGAGPLRHYCSKDQSRLLERSIKELSLMATLSLARKGAIILGATLAQATLTQSAEARWYGCWGCGAFAAGAIAGAAIAAPYAPPVYYAPRPVVVAPPVAPVVVAPAPVVTPVYPVCPALPPYPYYCR